MKRLFKLLTSTDFWFFATVAIVVAGMVVAIFGCGSCGKTPHEPAAPAPAVAALTPHDTAGVYVIQCVPGMVKIGRAHNIAERMRELQTGCPFELKLLAVLSTNPDDESSLHRRFARDRRHGEWFALSPELADAIHTARKGNNQ